LRRFDGLAQPSDRPEIDRRQWPLRGEHESKQPLVADQVRHRSRVCRQQPACFRRGYGTHCGQRGIGGIAFAECGAQIDQLAKSLITLGAQQHAPRRVALLADRVVQHGQPGLEFRQPD
jgi:hypothetical protein